MALLSVCFRTRISVLSVQHSKTKYSSYLLHKSTKSLYEQLYYFFIHNIHSRSVENQLYFYMNFYNFKQPRSCLPVSRWNLLYPKNRLLFWTEKCWYNSNNNTAVENWDFFCIPTWQKLLISTVDYSVSSGPPVMGINSFSHRCPIAWELYFCTERDKHFWPHAGVISWICTMKNSMILFFWPHKC